MRRRIVLAKFPTGGMSYAYYTLDVTLKRGDIVVVEAKGQPAIARLIKTSGLSASDKMHAHSWVIQKVDIEAHQKRLDTYYT